MRELDSGKMRAVYLMGHGGVEQLAYRDDAPVPAVGPGEVLIRVHACGMNNTDVNTRVGWYSKAVTGATDGAGGGGGAAGDATWGGAAVALPRIQGADVCGVVAAVGEGVDARWAGRRVLVDTWLRDWENPDDLSAVGYFGSECDGGFAEFVAVDVRQVHAVESNLSSAELATFATSYSTAEGMLARAEVGAGDTVLITGASGGVGGALIQLARRRGARTVAVCGEDKREAVRALGADAVLPRVCTESAAALEAALRAATGAARVSVVADVVGGDGFAALIEGLARGGRYVCSGAIAGAVVRLDLRTFYLNNLSFFGSTILPAGMFAELVGYIARGEVQPLLAGTFPLERLREAQEVFVKKAHVGNFVITL